jgi:hypothetical protein
MKTLPDNFYELDGYTQLKVCGCEACREILKNDYDEDFVDQLDWVEQYGVDTENFRKYTKK